MVQAVGKNIYSIPVPLPKSPLKVLNAYVIKAEDKTLLIDTGFNHPKCLEALLEGLEALNIDIEKMEVLITHLHVDHSGLAAYFADQGCKVYCSSVDAHFINSAALDQGLMDPDYLERAAGMDKGEYGWDQLVISRFKPSNEIPFFILDPGDTYQIGDYDFQVVDLIGHTPGHIGLYDPAAGIMFSGDTVLDPISPNITYWNDSYPDILGNYLETLKRITNLPVSTLYAAHREIIHRPQARALEIIDHHHERLEEILGLMADGQEHTIKSLAGRLSWRVKMTSWDDFPAHQKWFAAGETWAHLAHLVAKGKVTERLVQGVLHYRLSD